MANSVVTTAQLTQVANAQKSYIDNKDEALKKKIEAETTARNEAIQGVVEQIPSEATPDEIKGITDLFAVAEAAE